MDTLTTVIAADQDGIEIRPFVIRPRYRWETFDSTDPEDYALYGPGVNDDGTPRPGFRARILVNPDYGDILAAEAALRESEDDFWQAVRPRVVEWNAWMADTNGVEKPMPAPGDDETNWQAPYCLAHPLVVWLMGTIRTAHVSSGMREQLAKNRADAREQARNPPPAADSETEATDG